MNYSFLAPRQIVFGWGRRSELGTLTASLGRRVMLVSGSRTLERTGVIDQIVGILHSAGLDVLGFPVDSREPEVRDVDQLVCDLRDVNPNDDDVVIAVGGGSTIDLAKAAAALVTNSHNESVLDFLEGVGRGLQITQPPLAFVAVPTTAGTGAEATKNAVISSNSPGDNSASSPRYKKSLRSDLMVPRLVVVDPELTVSVPPDTTASTGMDAITQLIESYISRRAAPIPQALCLQSLRLAMDALPAAVADGTRRDAREAMSHAALLSGIALANSGLGMAHGVAAALGVTCQVPHGLACAVMLPATLRANCDTVRSQLAVLETLFDSSSDQVSGADKFVKRIERLCSDVGIPIRLRDIGVLREQIPSLVTGSRGNSMSGNQRDISDDELQRILEQLW
jgi:alcohol dehydrogenase class IV